jgi:hypothetical protein
MMIGILPLAFVAFALLIAMTCGGRACRTRSVPGALIGGALLSFGVGGALLLLGSAFFLAKAPHPIGRPLEEFLRMPPAPPVSPRLHQTDEMLVAEAPEVLEADAAVMLAKPAAVEVAAASGPPRPAWMDAPTGRAGDVYRTRTKVGPYFSLVECEGQLPNALRQAVQAYADRQLGEGKGQFVNLPTSYIHDHIVHGEWEERKQDLIEPMIYLHVLLEFDSDARRAIDASYRNTVVVGRLSQTATAGGVVLGLLTIIFGYLKLDTLTRGYYTWRLRLTATAAILGLAAIAGLLVLG